MRKDRKNATNKPFIIGQNSVPGIQLAHRKKSQRGSPWEGGKKLDPTMGLETVAPSAMDFMMMRRRYLNKESKSVSDFKSATKDP
jgi:hypothetical protein